MRSEELFYSCNPRWSEHQSRLPFLSLPHSGKCLSSFYRDLSHELTYMSGVSLQLLTSVAWHSSVILQAIVNQECRGKNIELPSEELHFPYLVEEEERSKHVFEASRLGSLPGYSW